MLPLYRGDPNSNGKRECPVLEYSDNFEGLLLPELLILRPDVEVTR